MKKFFLIFGECNWAIFFLLSICFSLSFLSFGWLGQEGDGRDEVPRVNLMGSRPP